jgi:hypothetical protein
MGFGASAAAESSPGSKIVFASPVPAQPVEEGSYELTFSFNWFSWLILRITLEIRPSVAR